MKLKSLLPAFALAILASLWLSASVAVSAQDAKPSTKAVQTPGTILVDDNKQDKSGNISLPQNAATPALASDTGNKISDKNPLALTDAERKALEPFQQAITEAEQELANAGNALYLAKNDAVLTAAYRWKAAATAFNFAVANRSNWIASTAKAHDCAGCELNLQTGEFQKAKQQ